MSNHFSADNLKFPGDDRRLDLTDLFVFKSPEDPDKTVLIIDSNPTSAPPPIPAPTTGPEFHPDAVYRINIDTDGDSRADIAFTFTFSEFENGMQTGSAWYATGSQAREPEPGGELLTDSLPVSFDGIARPVRGRPDPAVRRAAQRPVLRRRRGRPARIRVDRARRLRREQRRLHRAGGTQRPARRRPGDRSLGHDQPAPRRHARADGPRRAPDHQPVHQPRRREEPLQLPPARRRRRQLPGAVVQNPGKQRLLARGGQGGSHAGAARHPPLRPHQARRPTPTAASSPTTSTACALPG